MQTVFQVSKKAYDHKRLEYMITDHNRSRSCSCFFPLNCLNNKVTEDISEKLKIKTAS